jgi:uncharacterized membrane protein
MKKMLIYMMAIAMLFGPACALAQEGETLEDKVETVKSRVVSIESERVEVIPGTETSHTVQALTAEILKGPSKGQKIRLDNDLTPLSEGDVFYLRHITPWEGGTDLYSVAEPYRLPALVFLTLVFIVLTIIFGGKQGVRGLLSLLGSLLLIAFVLLPAMANGYSPILVSIGVSSLIIVLGSYVTHGFNKTTSAAVIGMIATVIGIGIFAHFSIGFTGLTGFESDEASYLSFNTNGAINLPGLLLGGILIGLLGVMYDAAIGQAIAVEELHRVAPHMSRRAIYARAIRIGREHIGALVNTLAIAYVGASLPLLLLFYLSTNESALVAINREVFSAEIVRTMVGSIGLILAVPVTTAIATALLIKKSDDEADEATLAREKEAIEHAGHHH